MAAHFCRLFHTPRKVSHLKKKSSLEMGVTMGTCKTAAKTHDAVHSWNECHYTQTFMNGSMDANLLMIS